MKSPQERSQTDELIQSILTGVVPVGIKISWHTNRPEPGNSDRRTKVMGDSGFDLAKLKEWEPGDRVDGLASAKTGWREILSAVYEEPRDLSVYVLVDASAAMIFGTHKVSEKALAAQLLGKILGAAARDDLAGVIVYDEKGVRDILPVRGARSQLLPALYTYLDSDSESEPAMNDERSGLEQALARLPVNQRCLVWVISPFVQLGSDELEALTNQSSIHDLLCLVVKDPRERELPEGSGILQMRDLRTGKATSIWLSKRSRAQWTAEYDAYMSELHKKLSDAGASFEDFSTAMDSTHIDQLLVPLLTGIRTQE